MTNFIDADPNGMSCSSESDMVVKPNIKKPDKITISKEILRALQAGDHNAFDEVFVLYFNKIKKFIYYLIRSIDEAEELSQNIFCNLWETREKIDPSKNFNAYIYVAARNAVYDYVRRKTVRDNFAKNQWDVDTELPGTDELIIAKEMQLLIDLVVSKMPSQRKRVFELSRYDNLSNDQIANQLEISRNAVEKQLRLALADIREVVTALSAFFFIIR